MKPLGKVKIEWSPKFAYALGLLTTDGNLSSNGRQFDFTSQDLEQVENFRKCLGVKNMITRKTSGSSLNDSFRVQFGDVILYAFLLSIGLTAQKSRTIGTLAVPDKFFFDFLRGHFDGDGTFYSYWDPRWRSSFMFYIELTSASKDHILWLQKQISEFIDVKGRITKSRNNSVYRLKYAKTESLKLLPKLYYNADVVCLSRKRKKIEKALKIEGRKL